MTKKRLTPQQQLRVEIDKTATVIIERATQMINQDVPVILSFRLAISHELEVQYYKTQLVTAEVMIMSKLLEDN